jgi:hypothetical protein
MRVRPRCSERAPASNASAPCAFFNPLAPPEVLEAEIDVGTPLFITSAKSVASEAPDSGVSLKLTQSNAIAELSLLISSIERNAAMLMHPLLIVWAQSLLARFHLIKSNPVAAMQYFDFALTNFLKHFASGPVFIPGNLRSINERLALFDLHADAVTKLHQKLVSVFPDAKIPLNQHESLLVQHQ